MAQAHVSKKRRTTGEDAEILNKVSDHSITQETLKEKLSQYVEKVSSWFSVFFLFVSLFLGAKLFEACHHSIWVTK